VRRGPGPLIPRNRKGAAAVRQTRRRRAHQPAEECPPVNVGNVPRANETANFEEPDMLSTIIPQAQPSPIPTITVLCALSLALELLIGYVLLNPVRRDLQWLKSATKLDPLTQLGSGAFFRTDIAQMSRLADSLVVLHIRLQRRDGHDMG